MSGNIKSDRPVANSFVGIVCAGGLMAVTGIAAAPILTERPERAPTMETVRVVSGSAPNRIADDGARDARPVPAMAERSPDVPPATEPVTVPEGLQPTVIDDAQAAALAAEVATRPTKVNPVDPNSSTGESTREALVPEQLLAP